jgi:hypothetical protein
MIEEAFRQICNEAKDAEGIYVALFESRPFYGGPEEGGWWGRDNILISYQKFETREAADIAVAAIQKLAYELTKEAKKSFGRQCLQEMEWLDERGLDSDYLREPDGESSYSVSVSERVPESSYGERGYS